MIQLEGANVKMWTEGVPVEHDALQQIRKVAELPVIGGHLAIMPDVHLGVGATVGSVIPTKAAIIPSAVGVDIGCGMCAVLTNLTAADLPDSLSAIRAQIERDVPVGFNGHGPSVQFGRYEGWAQVKAKRDRLLNKLAGLRIIERLGSVDEGKVLAQAGSLGGGNHFIELCLDEQNRVWVMLHSGSRNIGKTIGECAINMAKKLAERDGVHLPDTNLAWLPEGTDEFAMYTEALAWAQDYAMINRELMLCIVLGGLRKVFPNMRELQAAVNCHHNYASLEEHFGSFVWLTRKGAVSAKQDELGIIPGSMGTKSYIVKGKGNQDAYCSCSHGAGRRMSRGEAKRTFTMHDFAAQTLGVECRKDVGVLDEIPGAYKDIDHVMAAQADLVDIVATLKQVLCVKG